MKMTIHFQLVPRLRMSGAMPPLSLYGFMACTGRNSTFYSTAGYVVPTLQRTTLPLSSKHKRVDKVSFQNVGIHATEHRVTTQNTTI
jgi:hypothetical protein